MSTRRVVGPFNRVEGDLEITLEIAAGRIDAAYVNSPLYRGFEQILQGKMPADALTLVPRICGICSVAQSMASALALADAAGIVAPPNGRLSANLTLATENLADHLTHFYLFFMPDFARDEYAGRPWHAATVERFRSTVGTASNEMLAARARFMQMMGLLAGKWPHTLAVQPGGSTRPLQASEIFRLHRILRDFRLFLERVTFASTLEDVARLSSRSELSAWQQGSGGGDLGHFLRIADDLDLWHLGRATDRFMSYGCYDEISGRLFPAGVWDQQHLPLDTASISEDISHAWYAAAGLPQHPAEGGTVPVADKLGAYSWCKAPRLAGQVVETGALARQLIAGHPLAIDMVLAEGGSVAARVVARLLELALVIPAMERWLAEITSGEPWCFPAALPEEASGAGLVEAARGSLGHWLNVKRGLIHSYQIVAPTTWNFSPRDAHGQAGALEQALVGLAATADESIPATIHHVVRSFDPCMVCTVH
ncbi:MAG: nickel-dependent hydrogenase large subunit [Propionivibrio sp.]|uniref:nickel-dependent hydrogenase large subunit n=1 Tax=Propionivibrio sp. TaxID=2212460 RepID=UPI0025FC43FF|nr:nickel-dependent hydrogenase large subunit [Propionivibrio sp.]MBK7356467.1 nickel-dependent hydrogenase large subunit [Propionivibrio sp.]MBK8400066.1 nickel-dependent hydrogenase large subunit [Propionivibrio sp.]MBK8893756.1 nickel-dependent hydrogenase large subunit [Propionivibrio sp.]MBL0207884.1 nickel-dependent hydrogenase large subunit [Propionivibrio sp.]